MSNRIENLLLAHKNNMISQFGHVGSSQTQSRFQPLAFATNLIIKHKGSIWFSTLIGYLLFQNTWSIKPLIKRVLNLTQATNRLNETGAKLREELAQAVLRVNSAVEKNQKSIEEVKNLKGLLVEFKESQELLLESEKQKREKMLKIFQEVQKESLENQKALEEQIKSLDEKNQKLFEILRKLFAPVSEYNQRLLVAGNEMDQLANTIEKLLNK